MHISRHDSTWSLIKEVSCSDSLDRHCHPERCIYIQLIPIQLIRTFFRSKTSTDNCASFSEHYLLITISGKGESFIPIEAIFNGQQGLSSVAWCTHNKLRIYGHMAISLSGRVRGAGLTLPSMTMTTAYDGCCCLGDLDHNDRQKKKSLLVWIS
jgi:hypothetical protein